jgi:Cellulase (glycosyl hydrolase family 5)
MRKLKIRLISPLGVATLFLLTGQMAGSQPNAPDRPNDLPGSWGVNVHTLFNGPALKAIGAQWIRLTLRWEDIERDTKGRYDWSKMDKVVSHYAANGFHLICILSIEQLNPLYSESAADKHQVSRVIARWMGATAKHFKGKGIIWEIGNEPEVFPMGDYWNSATTYTEMSKLSARAIKQSDPAAKIAVLSLAWMDRAYASTALSAGILEDGTIDYISFHGYHRKTIEPESGLAEDIGWLRMKAASAAPRGTKAPEIIDTETGYALADFESPKAINNWRLTVFSEEAQAAYLARHFLEEISLGLPISIWYKDMHGESGSSLYYVDDSDSRGLRPMGQAFRTLARLLPDNPASLRNEQYSVSVESMRRYPARDSETRGVPHIHVRSFLRTDPEGQRTLIVAVWNAVEAFQGKILASRTFTSSQCFEHWRDIRPSDPVDVPSRLNITGLSSNAIQSIRVLSLPSGEPAESPAEINSRTNISHSSTSLAVTAKPMPTIVVVTLRST